MLGLRVLVVAALPTAPPELLVDIDTQHSYSHPPQRAGANADGCSTCSSFPRADSRSSGARGTGGVRELGIGVPAYVLRAGKHAVAQGLNPTNEADEALIRDTWCNGIEADTPAWLMCRSPDAGRDIVVTD
jgi:hypothetical protein